MALVVGNVQEQMGWRRRGASRPVVTADTGSDTLITPLYTLE